MAHKMLQSKKGHLAKWMQSKFCIHLALLIGMDMVHRASKVKVVPKEHSQVRADTKQLKNNDAVAVLWKGEVEGRQLKDLRQILKAEKMK